MLQSTAGHKTLGGVLDVVLGISMAPTAVRMALVEGQDGDGLIVEEDTFPVGPDPSTTSAPDQVIAAILGTREGAVEAGLRLSSVGVTCPDDTSVAALRDVLAAHKLENVMLVSAFLAAAALGQAVGGAVGYERTAVLFIEPDTATLAVVDTADGSVSEVRRQLLSQDDNMAAAEVVDMVAGVESMPSRPDGVYVVGTGVDIALIKPALEAATSLTVSVPEEDEMALARGAALAAGNAPLFASSTAALAYAHDLPDPDLRRDEFVAGSVPDDSAGRRSALLIGSAVAVIAIAAVVALEVALAINIRPTVALLPKPSENHLVTPTDPAPAPTQVAAAPQPKIDLPRPAEAPRAASPQLPAPLPAASVAEAPVLPALPAPVLPAPKVPVRQIAPAPDPAVVVPPLLPFLVPPVLATGPETLLRPPVPQAPAQLPRPQPQAPAPRVEVPASPPRIVSPVPRKPVRQPPPVLAPSPNPGHSPGGGAGVPGRRGPGGGPGGKGPIGGKGPLGGKGPVGGGGPFGGGGHGGGGHGGFGGGHGPLGGGGHGGGHGGFGGGHGPR
ncbi:hypothetical protein C3470_19960 [Mycobacterium kansasii]|nr:hypothetical protein C3470_19960 [Mycobacterium kansasii]